MRRTGYIFNVEHDNPRNCGQFKVLAYSVEKAYALLEARGYYNVERVAKPTTQRPQGGGFRVIPSALAEARDFLGLAFPVKIRTHARAGSVRGNYRLGHDAHGRPFHNIMLKDYLDPEQASKTLWHELTHAMQAERACTEAGATTADTQRMAWSGVRNLDRGIGYRRKSIEVEAREGEQYAEALPLTK